MIDQFHTQFSHMQQVVVEHDPTLIEIAQAERLMNAAGLEKERGWLQRHVQNGMVNLGELLMRFGADLVEAYETPIVKVPCEDRKHATS